MGAQNLLPKIDPDAPLESLRDPKFSGKKIVVDLATLLHRGKLALDVERVARLQQKEGSDVPDALWQPLYNYVRTWSNKIADCVAEVTFVLDGHPLGSKATENEGRKARRLQHYSNAVDLLKESEEHAADPGKARKEFAAAVHVSNDTVKQAVVDIMTSSDRWRFIQAPNEADAQCALLAKSVDLVLCGDSDMILYGCEEVWIIKSSCSDVLSGYIYRIAEAFANEDHLFSGLNLPQLVAVCLLTGCDFSRGVKWIGYAAAVRLIREHWDASDPYNIEALLSAAVEMVSKAEVPADFQQQWDGAWNTFRHHRVFDESTNTIRFLHAPAPEMVDAVVKTVGRPILDTRVSRGLASGFCNPENRRPWDEVRATSEDAAQLTVKAQIIKGETDSIARQLDGMDHDQLDALSNIYDTRLAALEARIAQLRAENPSDPAVVEWDRKERLFKSNGDAYRSIIASEGLTPVDEKRVIQWAVFVIQQLENDHGSDFSLYALKARPDQHGVPHGDEDTAYVTRIERNPTAVKPVESDEVGNSADEAAAIVGGRHFRKDELLRHGEPAGQDTTGMLRHRFLQFSEFFRGDAGAFLGELFATKVSFVLLGGGLGGTGRVLNRTYVGVVRDPAGLKEHSFGISTLIEFVPELRAGTMGINKNQMPSVFRQFEQNIPCKFLSLSVLTKRATNLGFDVRAALAVLQKKPKLDDKEKAKLVQYKAIVDARDRFNEYQNKRKAEIRTRVGALRKKEELGSLLEEEQQELDAAEEAREAKSRYAKERYAADQRDSQQACPPLLDRQQARPPLLGRPVEMPAHVSPGTSLERIELELPPGSLGVGIIQRDGICVVSSKSNQASPLAVGDVIVSLNTLELKKIGGGVQAWVGLFVAMHAESIPRKVVLLRAAANN